uniref:Putative DNA-directed RNA polymerase II subunit 3 n=1 Tax=Trypanosoma vivax (strain Y486) TaxID=1055687 RepID=G0TTC8_TRYVY|nr:putative DNA-directed RNA polymerase II subunit 3 [Trypanosoma vivax Y486]
MGPSRALNICTMVWPSLDDDESGGWLIGWNPRGLVVIVVAVVKSASEEDVRQVVNQMNKSKIVSGFSDTLWPEWEDVPSCATLRVLGWLRCGSMAAGTCNSRRSQVRSQQRASGLWLELNKGPVLDQLWCCDYHVQPCDLHVIRTDPSVTYATTPTVFSAVARFERTKVMSLVQGHVRPICIEGANSPLEGVLLPLHMAASAGPRDRKTQLANGTPNGHCIITDTQLGDRGNVRHRDERKVLPPRLNFATSSDSGHLSLLLHANNFGKTLREAHSHHNKRVKYIEGEVNPVCDTSDNGPSVNYVDAVENTSDATCPQRWCETCVGVLVGPLKGFLSLILWLPTRLSEISHTVAMLDFRLRLFIHLLHQLNGQTSICCLHPVLHHMRHSEPAMRRFCVADFISRCLVDAALGTLLYLLLSRGENVLVTKAENLCKFFLYDAHMSYMEWFKRWPAGLKTNEDLSMTLSFLAELVLQESWASVKNLDWVHLFYKLLKSISPFGASIAFAFMADICLTVSLHLLLLFRTLAVPYRLSHSVLVGLFLQFRGKKYNPLRKRTDTYDFSAEEMLMGTLIFTIVVFLFPTITVYYLYFAFVRSIVWLAREAFVAAAHITLCLPLYSIVYWALCRNCWSGGVVITGPRVICVCRNEGNSSIPARTSTTLEFIAQSKPLQLQALLADFLLVFHVILKVHPLHMVAAVFKGNTPESVNMGRQLIPHLHRDGKKETFSGKGHSHT